MGQGSVVAVSCGYRHGSDLVLVWLWCGPVATAPIRPLSWEPPYAARAALKKKSKRQKKKKKKKILLFRRLHIGRGSEIPLTEENERKRTVLGDVVPPPHSLLIAF